MKIHIHICIIFKISYKSGADSSSRFREITIWKKKVKIILSSNISEVDRPINLPKELDRELSKIYLHKEFWKD